VARAFSVKRLQPLPHRAANVLPPPPPPPANHLHLIDERDPLRFRHALADAVSADDGRPVFIADPTWGERERTQFAALATQPTLPFPGAETASATAAECGWLCIPTGGSSGNLKLARHDEQTLAAAVDGFCQHFDVSRINAVGLLPLHHISGLMSWIRCALTGGTYRHADWKRIERGEERPVPAPAATFLSLVPTQLHRLLNNADESALTWLRRFRAIFIGGGPSWPALIEAGAAARLPLAFSYGMTETAAMVTALTPEEFAAGLRGTGRPMPHARIDLLPDNANNDANRMEIRATSLFRGYWPGWRALPPPPWETGDTGSFDATGSLHIAGRRDALIITGGEKVNPQEVEEALRATGFFPDDVAVTGVPDPDWGHAVVACYPAGDPMNPRRPPLEVPAVRAALAGKLSPFKQPRRYVAVTPWPRSPQGKLNREALRRHAAGDIG
jgi:O-succinylbenzoic acid--CoA ligase